MGVSGLLLLDKDEGWTSQDCVSKLRGILGERRIGHSGTLDPMATGLLVILVGRATRAASYAEAETKEYLARFRPGLSTDTQDITGTPVSRGAFLPTEDDVRAALPRFTGEILQIPPMYSAVKVNGQKLYQIARRGGTAERKPRPVTSYSLEYAGRDGEDHLLKVCCSKGTYIRTLCHDLGEALFLRPLPRGRRPQDLRDHPGRPRPPPPRRHAVRGSPVRDAGRGGGSKAPQRERLPLRRRGRPLPLLRKRRVLPRDRRRRRLRRAGGKKLL